MGLKLTTIIGISGFFLCALATTDRWTIQTIAYRDYSEAADVSMSLASLGYPSYTEFAMNDGLQYTRVRLGCFETRDGAERMATHLRDAVTAAAVPQILSPEFPLSSCSDNEVGFFKPADWSIAYAGPSKIVFEVYISGYQGFIEHSAGSWHITGQPETQDSPSDEPYGPFFQREVEGRPIVFTNHLGSLSAVCPGLLLWQTIDTAIVDDRDAILSCKAVPLP